jgi:hypothetical protein
VFLSLDRHIGAAGEEHLAAPEVILFHQQGIYLFPLLVRFNQLYLY